MLKDIVRLFTNAGNAQFKKQYHIQITIASVVEEMAVS
jgi:hypothetical protein